MGKPISRVKAVNSLDAPDNTTPPPVYRIGRLASNIKSMARRTWRLLPLMVGLYERMLISFGYSKVQRVAVISLGISTNTGPGRPVLAM